ncbi:MAG: hypothetical protein ACR2RL_10200 [Gammaproteobacteria bacterium]
MDGLAIDDLNARQSEKFHENVKNQSTEIKDFPKQPVALILQRHDRALASSRGSGHNPVATGVYCGFQDEVRSGAGSAGTFRTAGALRT